MATDIKIKRHIKIRAEATPYDPQFIDYFRKRGVRAKSIVTLSNVLVAGSASAGLTTA
jgi:hypothetical protein